MRSPLGIVKRRVGAAIQSRVDRSVDLRTQALMATVHGLSEQLARTSATVADWRIELDSSTGGLAQTVNGVSQQLAATAATLADWQHEWHQTMADVRVRLDEVDHRSKESAGVATVLNQLDAQLKSELRAGVGTVQVALSDLAASVAILQSRIRALPYSGEASPSRTEVDGISTLGFRSGTEGSYVEFSDCFRPSDSDLVAALRSYQRWMPAEGAAVDLGAGRGEMVAVMTEVGLSAYGIDMDQSMVDRAVQLGRDVRAGDALGHLNSLDNGSVVQVSAIHVVEHLDTPDLVEWLSEIARVLEPGGRLIIETPNPHAIDAFKAFWLDVTHVRPYYPEALLNLVEAAGFSEAFVWADGDATDIQERLGIAGAYSVIASR